MIEAPRHILSASDLNRAEIEDICQRSEIFGNIIDAHNGRSPFTEFYRGRNCATVFGEPSTRTRISSENAAAALGMHVSSITAETASMVKGETPGRTALTLGALGTDLIVMRLPQAGAVAEAAKMSRVPLVNGGDGANEHPTQMLLDIATAKKHFGRIDGTHWTAFGDIGHSRTLNSLVTGLSQFEDVSMTLVAPEGLGPSERTLEFLERSRIPYDVSDSLKDSVGRANFLYGIRSQAERHIGDTVVRSHIVLDREVMANMNPDTVILHPGPHGPEIADEVYDHPNAVFPESQVRSGYLTRMALFDALMGNRLYGSIVHDSEFGAVEQFMTAA